MTEVYCTFDECLFYKPHDEDYGICTKDHITLDEIVSERTCGCPDAEWDEPQTEMTTEQIVNELLSIKKILDDGKMPKQTHDIRTNTHECVKDTHDKTEPQTDCAWREPCGK